MIEREETDMVGTKYASEKRIFTDPKSGAQITQLTNQGINYHFYFTENSFDLDGKTIYFDMRKRRSAIYLKWIWKVVRWNN